MGTILIVEDEKPIREFIAINLKREKYEVLEVGSGEEALTILANKEIDLVILDLQLPGIDGYEVCQWMRKNAPEIAIIMVTAKSRDMDKVLGLELGADDYVIKPFNTYELMARVRSVLRRTKRTSSRKAETIVDGKIKINPLMRLVYKNEETIEMPPKEFDLLYTLAQSPGEVFDRDRLLDLVWAENFFGDMKTVDVHIRRLREKIEDNPSKPIYIETVWGIGYRWRCK